MQMRFGVGKPNNAEIPTSGAPHLTLRVAGGSYSFVRRDVSISTNGGYKWERPENASIPATWTEDVIPRR